MEILILNNVNICGRQRKVLKIVLKKTKDIHIHKRYRVLLRYLIVFVN